MSLIPHFYFSEAVRRARFCLPLGLLAARNVSMSSLQRTVEVQKSRALDRIRARDEVVLRVACFSDFFAARGYSCPLPHQLRIVEKKGFPQISPSVDALLVCEVMSGLLMGVQDLDAIEGELVCDLAQGGEWFHSLRGIITCKAEEIVLRDRRSIIASYFQGPNRRINVMPNTTSLLFFVFGAPNLDPAAVGDAVKMAADLVSPNAEEIEMKTFEE